MCDGAGFHYPDACIVVFARAPEHGRVKTRLAAGIGSDAALAVYQQLLKQTLRTVASSQLAPVELHIEGDIEHPFVRSVAKCADATIIAQQGADLGERMYRALGRALEQYDSVLIIGTDCPVMDAAYLGSALQQLANDAEVVVGPSEDGGYVLIGATCADQRVFSNINWGSARVMQQTRDALVEADICYGELDVLWDVDHADDYWRWQNNS